MRTHPRRDGTCAWRPWNAWLTSPIKLLICTLNSQFTGDPFLTTCINKLGLYAAGLFVSVITFLFHIRIKEDKQGWLMRVKEPSKKLIDLGVRFVPFDVTIRETVDCFRNKGLI
jgi:hypothetical protein